MNKLKYEILTTLNSSDEDLGATALLNGLKEATGRDINTLQKHLDDLVTQELVTCDTVQHDGQAPLRVTSEGRDYIDQYIHFRKVDFCSYVALACSFISVVIAFSALLM